MSSLPVSILRFVGVLAAVVTAGCKPSPSRLAVPGDPRPHVVLISLESLRADHVRAYGYDRETTPALDRFAQTATRYTRAYAVTSWTLTSHASMFTGLHPGAHRVRLPQDRLADAYTTTAELLNAGGYQCAAFVSGPYLRGEFNLTQGFAHRDESAASTDNDAAHRDITNPALAKRLDEFLRGQRDGHRPLFLFAYYWDTHYDYLPPAPFDRQFVPAGAEPVQEVQFGPLVELGKDLSEAQLAWLIAQYDGEIRATDGYVGQLFELLQQLGLWDNALVIVTADHGEQFFEHRFLGHKHDLYVEELHVPLLVKFPRQRAGRIDDRPVSLVDLHPTICGIAGLDDPSPCAGQSLLAEGPAADRALFFEVVTNWNLRNRRTGEVFRESYTWSGIQAGPRKFVQVHDTDFWQLFDVENDPREQRPLEAEKLPDAPRLRDLLAAHRADQELLGQAFGTDTKAALTEEQKRRLRSLGYIGEE